MRARPRTGGEPWEPFVEALRAFVRRRVPQADCDDVLQDILVRLHVGSNSLRDDQRAEAWVYGIGRRAIADFYRRRPANHVGLAEAETIKDPSAVEPEQLHAFEGDHDVHEEVLSWILPFAKGLPAQYRDALLLADFEGVSQQDIADRLGLSLSGAKSRVQRARRMVGGTLRTCCSVEFGPDGRASSFQSLTARDSAVQKP